MVSPLGDSREEFWAALCSGTSGITAQTVLPAEALPVKVAGEARRFSGKIDDFGPLEKETKKAIRKGLKVMCRECQMGIAAAQLALADAGFEAGLFDPQRIGVTFGSDYMITVPEEFVEGIQGCLDEQGEFEFSRWATEGMPKMSPLWLLKYLPNMPASHLAIYNNLCGPSNSITLREASSNAAVGEAYQTVLRGHAEAIVAGAAGTRLHPLKMVHAVQQEELAQGNGDPSAASRPFDRDRSGMVLGEGAGAVLLESLESAEARGATIYAEVLGEATSSSVAPGLVARCDRAMANAMRAALRGAGLEPGEVGHVHAHGLSTRAGDVEEARAIQEVFGERAEPVPVVAGKSYFGNLGAGSGAVELIASLLALHHGQLFPVLNYESPDPECPVAAVTESGGDPGRCFVNLNVTPQGQAAAVVIGRMG